MPGARRARRFRPAALSITLRWSPPVIGLEALCAIAWALYAAMLYAAPAASAGKDLHWWCSPVASLGRSANGGALAATVASGPMWIVMVLATTLPATLPASQYVAVNSFRHRRWQAVGEFMVIHIGLWVSFGLIATAVLTPLAASRTTLLVIVLSLATAWELTTLKRWALNRCHRTSPLPPRGWKATAGVMRFAWLNASGCIGSCWLVMIAMLTAPTARIGWAIGLGALGAYEKVSRQPRRAARRSAALLAAATTGVGLGLLIG